MVGDRRSIVQRVPADHPEHLGAAAGAQARRQPIGLAGSAGAEGGMVIDLPRAGVVGDLHDRMAEHGLRVRFQGSHAPRQVSRTNEVVVRRPLEVPPARALEDHIVVLRGADVGFLPIVANAPVGGRIASADLRGAIGRGVIGDDQLEIRKCLGEDRLDRLGEERRTVVDREPDADRRPVVHFLTTR